MIGCVTPFPPSRSGVADYAVDLLREMRRRTEVKVFVEDMRSRLALPGWPIEHFSKNKCEQVLYQLGNNGLHLFAYRQALRRPGVIVLHDALLQHMLLGDGWGAWEDEFVFTYGDQGRAIAANLRGGNPATHEGFFRYPLVKRVVQASRRVIVTNDGARARVLDEAPEADVRVIPLPFVRRGREVSRSEARANLGISPDAFVVGCLGYMRESRLLPAALRAFEELRLSVPGAEMVLVGEFTTPAQETVLAARMRSLRVRRPGHVTDAEFEEWGMACDVVVNPRYPTAGETSGVAVRMMGLGVPVILTDNAENAAYPDDACLKLPHDEREEALLIEYLLALAGNPELGEAIGANAREYIRREHDLNRVVDAYLEAL
jgi:glycosyltransferase involved in cell wall biosynthesis